MQKEKTLQFWDDFYRTVEKEEAKEWIIQPSDSLFRCMLDSFQLRNGRDGENEEELERQTFKVLEIGCGTSLLSEALCKYWEHHEPCRTLHVVASDVSQVCIEQQQKLQSRYCQNDNNMAILEYQVLNITETHIELASQYDLILDKGCLDTCLFRSKNTETWIDIVIQNLHSWLKPHGSYTIITPRSKIKHVRDYPGFDVTRKILTAEEFGHGDLEPRSGNKQNQSFEKEQSQYMYVCHRR
jgi:SAM-dependent methyltransferase